MFGELLGISLSLVLISFVFSLSADADFCLSWASLQGLDNANRQCKQSCGEGWALTVTLERQIFPLFLQLSFKHKSGG